MTYLLGAGIIEGKIEAESYTRVSVDRAVEG
jgi:hypothetical protein